MWFDPSFELIIKIIYHLKGNVINISINQIARLYTEHVQSYGRGINYCFKN